MLEVKNLTKVYGNASNQTVAVDHISFCIEDGEFVALVGKSGCGKSTLLSILGGMDVPTGGEYYMNGIKVVELRGRELSRFRNKEIGFVFQSFYLVNEMNAVQNVELPLGYGGWPSAKRRQRAKELLDRVGLSEKYHNRPAQLSGGEQQRVAIARAIANDPKILLADEPTGNLDRENGKKIMELLKELNRKGLTIIMVTHDEELAGQASRIMRMSDGKIVQRETTGVS